MDRGKPWWRSRTIWLGVALLAVQLGTLAPMIVDSLERLGYGPELVERVRIYSAIAAAVATIWLRLDTKEPVRLKGDGK